MIYILPLIPKVGKNSKDLKLPPIGGLSCLKNGNSIKISEFKQKIINDYKGFNLPTLAETVLELIDVSLSGEDEIFEFV